MRVLTPGRGWTSYMTVEHGAVGYALLGPFSVGAFVRRVWVSLSTDVAAAVYFGLTLGGSEEATQVAFEAGVSLIERSVGAAHGKPTAVYQLQPGLAAQVVVPCGRVVHSGSRYVVCYGAVIGVGALGTFQFSAEVMEVREVEEG